MVFQAKVRVSSQQSLPLVVVGQNISLPPSCRWSKYFVIVGLPTNNLAAEGQNISDLEAEFNEH
jgi:hypothetical protein